MDSYPVGGSQVGVAALVCNLVGPPLAGKSQQPLPSTTQAENPYRPVEKSSFWRCRAGFERRDRQRICSADLTVWGSSGICLAEAVCEQARQLIVSVVKQIVIKLADCAGNRPVK